MTQIRRVTTYFVPHLILILVSGFVLSACKSAHIQNVENRPFNSGVELPLETIALHIKLIAAPRGWSFADVAPGHLIATMETPKHTARVNVHFTKHDFSITYLDSENMQSDGRSIHSRYTRWLDILSHDLATQVGLVQMN